MELKVTTETIVRAPWAFERRRLVPWWCQSIISGTPLIVYGIRDYDGHVSSIDHVRTDEIPDRVGRENLDPEKYLKFLSDILTWIKYIVCVEDYTSVYAFQWDPNAPGRGVTANALLRDAGNTFLPEWYVSEMEDYFTLAVEERQRKGVKRGMEDENERKGQKIKMKGLRERMEESWPRTSSSHEPNTRVENPHTRGQDVRCARSRSPGSHNPSYRGRTKPDVRDLADEERYSKKESFRSEGHRREYPRPRSPGFHDPNDRGGNTEIRDLAEEERYSRKKSFRSERYRREYLRPRSPGFHDPNDRRGNSEIRDLAEEESNSRRVSFGDEGYKRKRPRPGSPDFLHASDRVGTTPEIPGSADEEHYSRRESFGREGYKREYPQPGSPDFYNVSDYRGATSEIRGFADEERYSMTGSSGSEAFKGVYSHPSLTREDNERHHLLSEDKFDRDRTNTRVYEQRPELYSSRSNKDKIGKTRRYERRRHEDQVQPQARVRSRTTFNESRAQRFSERDYPSSTDDRTPTKRVKRDAEYEKRGIRHQNSTRYNPHRN